IPGEPPDLYTPPEGCSFAKRCPHCMKICLKEAAPNYTISSDHHVCCWREESLFQEINKAKK
ncbi:MAG: peptide ABC transporter ATP-binding protein, partial [Coprobacillus sp.]